MKKYFVVSDLHSYYDEFISALKKAKYDKDNVEHILIVLGDIFDRGEKPLEIFKYLRSIPEDRLILIRGNHEDLLIELVNNKMPYSRDRLNGTYDTLKYLYKDPLIEAEKYVNYINNCNNH